MTRSIKKFTFFSTTGSIVLLLVWVTLNGYHKSSELKLTSGSLILPAKNLNEFSLNSTLNKKFTNQSLKGHWTLMFFGYSDCPDICPMTVSIMKKVWDKFDNNKKPARFVFVSINPQIDSTFKLKSFLKRFDSSFIGVNGDEVEIEKIKKPLGIYSAKNDTNGTGNIIDHSSSLMLINPKGQLTALFSPPFNVESIATDLKIITKS